MAEEIIATTVPHSEFGDLECCGCLNVFIRGDLAEFVCNECGKVVRAVSASELRRTLDEMELALGIATAMCPHCGAVHLAPAFSKLRAYICRKCGKAVKVA